MQTLKSVFGVLRAVVPVLYCGGLVYYFLDVGGSVEGAQEIGLGPTVLGLGIVGFLFCIPLILKLVRIFAPPPSSGSGPDTPGGDDKTGFDVDGEIARYMIQRSAQALPSAPSARPPYQGGGAARRAGFGRRIR